MDEGKYWIAVDERGDETIHQYEPHYNHLHMKWKSINGAVYVSKGLINILVNNNIEDKFLKAYAYMLSSNKISTKATILETKKIYKDK